MGSDANRIGLIGAGFIGHGLATCLLDAGRELHVFDIHADRTDDLAARGATCELSPEAVAAVCDVTFVAVVSDDQVEQVLFGDSGLAADACAGKVFIDTATIPPARSREFAGRVAERGGQYLDAPLIGGQTDRISETMPVGGTVEAFGRCRPLLEIVAKNVVHIGPAGTGQVVKLMNQTQVCARMAAAAEAVAWAEAWSVPLGLADEALGNHGRAVAWIADSAKEQQSHGDLTHWTRLFLKDMNCAVGSGLPMLVAHAVRDLNERAMEVEPENGWPYSFLAAARDIMERDSA
jgi:3-hydroxyisobutyrate dehydrogenase-like beta-hydroxyacid dehydrogenase